MANGNTTRWNLRGSAREYHLTVSKKIRTGRNDPGPSESFEQPVIPPAPLTGDVGRDCGDASRALLLFKIAMTIDLRTPAKKPGAQPSASGFSGMEMSGLGYPGRPVAGIALEEQGLARYRGNHRRLERFRDQERRLRPLAGEEALRVGRDENHRHLEYPQQLVDCVEARAAVRQLDVGED